MKQRVYGTGFLVLLTASAALAQSAAPAGAQKEWLQQRGSEDSQKQRNLGEQLKYFPGNSSAQNELERYFKSSTMKMYPGPTGRWWSNPQTAERLGVTPDQVRKMDDIFQQHRLKLIDLNASLAKEEAILEPLVGADQPDDAKVMPQIDRVAQARAELEKANARMLWAIRRVLTPEQWKKLQSDSPKPRLSK